MDDQPSSLHLIEHDPNNSLYKVAAMRTQHENYIDSVFSYASIGLYDNQKHI